VLAADRARLALGVRVRWLPAAGVAADGAQLELDEGAAALALTGGVGRGGWAVLGAAQLGGSLVRARAIVDDGREGARTVLIPSLASCARPTASAAAACAATGRARPTRSGRSRSAASPPTPSACPTARRAAIPASAAAASASSGPTASTTAACHPAAASASETA
jgi:hypothetical protein